MNSVNYHKYKFKHSRGKSDTDFHKEKLMLDGANIGITSFRDEIFKDLEKSQLNIVEFTRKKSDCQEKTPKNKKNPKHFLNLSEFNKNAKSQTLSFRQNNSDNELYLSLLEKILLFKKELDIYFFQSKLQCLKFHLDNISMIIRKHIQNVISELIKDFPLLREHKIIKVLNSYIDVINCFLDTKPRFFYREIKNVFLNQLEQNKKDIINFYNDIEENNFLGRNYMLKKYLLSKKQYILGFISSITQCILFSLSKLYYETDYYSLIISSLTLKVVFGIVSFIENDKNDKSLLLTEKLKDFKILHIIEHLISLCRNFYKTYTNESTYFKGMNSLSKFMLNNIVEYIPKCCSLVISENSLESTRDSLYKELNKYINYKYYLCKLKSFNGKYLLKLFRLYYNSKLIFWKNILFQLEDNKIDKLCCRVCERKISLNEFILHVNYCKEKKLVTEKNHEHKKKLKYYLKLLELYRIKITKGTLSSNKHNIFSQAKEINEMIKNIKNKNNINIDNEINTENNSDINNFIKTLSQIYIYEKDSTINDYENKKEQSKFLINICYLSLIIYISNKISDSYDEELNDIFGKFFSLSLEKLINILLLLYINENIDKNHDMKQFQNYSENNYKAFKPIIKNSNKNVLSKLKNIYSPKKKLKKNLLLSRELFHHKNKKENNNENKGISAFKIKLNNYKDKLSLNNAIFSNKKLKVYDFRNSFTNLSMSTNSNTELSKKKFKVESPLKTVENIEYLAYFNRKSNNISPSFLDSKRNNTINIQKEANISLFQIKNFMKRMKSSENLSFIFKQDNNKNEKIKLNKLDLNKIKISDKSNNNNIDESINNSINYSKRNSSSSEYQSNNSINSSSLSSVDCDLNSCINGFQDSDDMSHFNNKEIKAIKSKFCVKNKDNNDKEIANFNRIIENEDNSYIDLKENVFMDSDVEFDDKEEIKEKCEENIGKIFIDEKKEKENNDDNNDNEENDNYNYCFLIDNKSNRKDTFSKLLKKFSEDNQKNYKEKISRVIEELLLYIENDKNIENIKDINDNKNNKETNDNKIFIPKNNLKSNEGINNNNKDNNQIENKINNNYKISINYIEAKPFKEELENNNENYKNIQEKENEGNSPIIKNSENNNFSKISYKSLSQKNLEKNDINEIKHPINIEQDNDLSVCRLVSKPIKISSFKLIIPIAKGGYGSVGLYKKVSTGDFYAIKSVNINAMKEKKLSKTLKQEQNILKEINSEYIVNSYFIFKDKKNYYYAMEYLPGGDVFKLLSSIILPETTIQLILAETILGINYLHKIHIIHHDIKPENILITKDGHFKLSDFGLSKTIKEDINYESYLKTFQNIEFTQKNQDISNDEDNNETDQAVGTLNYMAPELFTDEYPEGPNIDYWSVGVILYELYSFKVPFEAKTQEQTRKNIIEMKINWDNLLNDEIRNQYKNIENGIDLIKKFLVKNPMERWGDNHLTNIKNHAFFKGFNWDNIQKIKNPPVMKYLKKVVGETNQKIKEEMEKQENSENYNDKFKLPCELDFELENESGDNNYIERLDNLTKRNNELIRMKFKKKEFHFKEIKDKESLFLDLK